jgi:hypothetical protein
VLPPQSACALPAQRHIEREVTPVIAGIDTHKDTLAVAVVDDTGRLVVGGDVANTERGFAQLVDMFTSHQVTRVGVKAQAASAAPSQCTWFCAGSPTSR